MNLEDRLNMGVWSLLLLLKIRVVVKVGAVLRLGLSKIVEGVEELLGIVNMIDGLVLIADEINKSKQIVVFRSEKIVYIQYELYSGSRILFL